MEREKFWDSCILRLKGQFKKKIFDAFIAPARAEYSNDGGLNVMAPNKATVRWLEENVAPVVRQIAAEDLDEPLKITFHANAALAVVETESADPEQADPESAQKPRPGSLRADHTFDNFVPGRANEMALAASRAISSKSRGSAIMRCLLLYGPTGMGKTHLAQAAGNAWIAARPGSRVKYVMARDFMNDVIKACRSHNMESFKQAYEGLDLLIVDDIQYIGGDKQRTQEEFFFLFNKMHDMNKRIIITSDRPPHSIDDMPDRLTSRLNSGMPCYLSPPELELREDILKSKALLHDFSIDSKCVRFVAEKVKSNVRELEGALNRIMSTCLLLGKPPTLELCRDTLSDMLNSSADTVDAKAVKEKVANFFKVRASDLASSSRKKSIAQARHVAVYLCRKLTNMSLPQIGEHFGNREHTTIMHSCSVVEKLLTTDPKMKEDLDMLEIMIKS